MAKLFGISGKATGRKGDTVFSVRNGDQIIRQYNPIVSNPSTSKQVDVRAKLKLLSQLSAIMGKYIAIPRDGAKSPRNLFTKVNYPMATTVGGVATIDMPSLQITKSAVGMAAINISRNGTTDISAAAATSIEGQFDRVVYVAVITDANSKMRVIGTATANVTNVNTTGAASLPYTTDGVTVLAYGVKDNNGKASAAFENIEGDAAAHIAKLVATRSLAEGDVTMSETVGASLTAL